MFNSFQVATVGYAYVLIEAIFGYTLKFNRMYIVSILLGAITTHIVITIHTFKKAKYGGYKLEGESVSFFINTKILDVNWNGNLYSCPIDINLCKYRFALKPMVFYFLQTIILYVFAVAQQNSSY